MKTSKLDGRAYDVVVCGGGTAGIAAACGAAKTGASTLLLERYGFCGGTPVAAMIPSLDASKNCQDTSIRVVGGIAGELLEELQNMGGMATPDNPPEALVFHPDFMKIAAERLLKRHSVEVLYYATVVDVAMQGNVITGVEAALRDGRARFRGKVVIDATGDADIVFLAGAPWQHDPSLEALTYHFRLGDLAGHLNWRELENACRRAVDAAFEKGLIQRYGGPWVVRVADSEFSVNATRVYGSPVDPVEITACEMQAREDMLVVWRILREGVPELRHSYIICGATQLHLRESRKMVGEYVLGEKEVLGAARFPDTIGVGAWPIDIHPTDGFVGVHPHKESPPPPYEIPYRCLVPLEVENLLVAGKPISSTHRAHGSTRQPGTSMATGHAAGVAAALAIKLDRTPRKLDVALLREELLQQGAIVNAPGPEFQAQRGGERA
jgi:hypothetical protein